MRPYFFLLLFFLPYSLTHADAYKCRNANGKIMISSLPCDEGKVTVSIAPSEHINPASLRDHRADLQRQKNIIAQAQQASTTELTPPAILGQPQKTSGGPDDSETRNRIHACLMKITATSGLSGWSQAQRKVGCYRGTVGLQGECETRITATLGLTSDQESYFRQQCRNLL
ncbi:MAG: DUF4124 domain-containing protein [Azonexus sp.]|jgi:hypothetical protein|nr:DUF4124 domain-containing protein [Azonexus sp.]